MFSSIIILLLVSVLLEKSTQKGDFKPLVYPKFKQVSKKWSYRSFKAKGNVTFADPFFWLENPLDSPDVSDFVDQQMALTENFLTQCQNKSAVSQSIEDSLQYDFYSHFTYIDPIGKKKPYYIYSLQRLEDIKASLYIATVEEVEEAKKNNFTQSPGKKYLDFSLLGYNGTGEVNGFEVSPDGNLFAYAVSGGDLDKNTVYFRSIDSPLVQANTTPDGGEGRLSDVLPLIAGYDVIFTLDNRAVLYLQMTYQPVDEFPEVGQRLRYHRIGTSYEDDITIVHPEFDENGQFIVWGALSSYDDKWLVVSGVTGATEKAICYATLFKGQNVSSEMKWISVSPSFDYQLGTIEVFDDYLYFMTDSDNALDLKVSKVKLDFSKARQVKNLTELNDRLPFTDVIPARPSHTLYAVDAFYEHYALLTYIEEGKYKLYLYNLVTGQKIQQLLVNETSNLAYTIFPFTESPTFLLLLSETTTPVVIYEITINGSNIEENLVLKINAKGSDKDDFLYEEFKARSKDGVMVPYEIVYRKGTPKDGSRPCWLHAYGMYGDVEIEFFEPNYFAWLASYGGFYIWASPRGGGDLGKKWHLAATNHTKQRTFDDIIAVGQDLVNRKICAARKLIGEGGSSGALAQLVVANQAPPGLFGAFIGFRPDEDIFLLERSDIGFYQIEELGSIYDPVDFDYIYAYSVPQNIRAKDYPAIIVAPGALDTRVGVAASTKYIAQLQTLNPHNSMPLLMYLAPGTGHSVSFNNTQYVIETTVLHCFLQISLGLHRYH